MTDPNTPNASVPETPPVAPPAPPVAPPTPPATPPAAPPAPPVKASGLATAALVVGIVAAVMAVVPGPSFAAFVPAILAGVLGLVTILRKLPGRGRGLAGVILGGVSLLVAIIVSVATIAGVAHVASSAPGLAAGAGSGPSSSSSDVSTPAATPTPAHTPTAAPVPADVSYSGTGDSVIPITLPDGADSPGIASFTEKGSGNFAVWSLDANAQQLELLVNTIGGYSGTRLFDVQSSQHTTSLQITADGAWTVTLHSIRSLRQFTESGATGHGDDVLVYQGKAGAAKISHDGASNFAIWEYGDSSDLVVNQIGAYSGVVRWTTGPSLVAITADGNWSIALQ